MNTEMQTKIREWEAERDRNLFVLTDVLETNLLEMQQKYKKEGFELRHDSKRNFNTAIAAIKRLKSDVNHCSESTQENFGNDSDMVNAMLLTLIDRCGDDDNLAYKMYEYIKSFPSKLNLDLDLDNAFSLCLENHENC